MNLRESDMVGMLGQSRIVAEHAVRFIHNVVSINPEAFMLVIEMMVEIFYEKHLGKKATFQFKVDFEEGGEENEIVRQKYSEPTV